MKLRRLPGWQSRFAAFIAEHLTRPFVWGNQDCALFAAASVRVLTGVDLAQGLRGTYRSELGAARVLREIGGLRAVAGASLGAEISPRSAAIGDVLLLETIRGEALAVCNGVNALAAGQDGLTVVATLDAIAAWRVG